MGLIRRVTLRCLCEDLNNDWVNTHQRREFARLWRLAQGDASNSELARIIKVLPPTVMIDHPLVKSFRSAFEDDAKTVRRESISGLSDPHFWKQKSNRWRGAATEAIDAVGDGEVWLCAGGLRARGDNRDFYNQFCSQIKARGPLEFLPTPADRRYQEVEAKNARKEAWREQIQLSTLICLNEALKTSEDNILHVPAPKPDSEDAPLLHVTFQVDRVDDAVESIIELVVQVHVNDPKHMNLAILAKNYVLNAVEPNLDAWNLLPGAGTDEIWATDVTPQFGELAASTSESGELPDSSRGKWAPASSAHYSHKKYLVEAHLEGDPVRGLCGKWFVPTGNPDNHPICPICDERYQALP